MVIFFIMLNDIKAKISWLIKTTIIFTPWIISIYIFYWLDYQVWTNDTPHRGKLSVILMTIGMALSFLLWTRLNKKNN
tara:strand:- start:3981 stop:4214 length:234 start_codon:yes stop_codon:yes gene_type:complete